MDEQVAAAVPARRERPVRRHPRVGPGGLNLIDNEPIVPVLEGILGAGFRLDHDYADLIRHGKGPIGTRLHGGATPFDAGQSYAVHEGQIRSGLVVVAYNLRDVNPGDGGFAGVPGATRRTSRCPRTGRSWRSTRRGRW